MLFPKQDIFFRFISTCNSTVCQCVVCVYCLCICVLSQKSWILWHKNISCKMFLACENKNGPCKCINSESVLHILKEKELVITHLNWYDISESEKCVFNQKKKKEQFNNIS